MSNATAIEKRMEQHAGRPQTPWNPADECMDRIVRNVKKTPPLLTVDILQNKRIAGLQQELSDVRKMLDMLLTLVDPEDVRAAFELRQVTPSHEELMELAEECVVPPELRGIQEENPWE